MSGRFDELSENLLRRGIAPRHVRRYVRELEEHFADLVAEGMAAGASRGAAAAAGESRIGRMEDLIEAMAARKELQSWIGRMPRTIPIAGPMLALFLFTLTQLFGFAALVEVFGPAPYWAGGRLPPDWLHPIMMWVFHFDNFLLPIVLGWAFAAASLRQRIGKGWMIGGLALMAVVAAPFIMHLQWPSNPTDNWSFSIGFPAEGWAVVLLRGAASFVLTAVPFWLLFDRRERTASIQ